MEESWLIDTFAIIGYDLSKLPRSVFNSSGLAVDSHIGDRPSILFRYPSNLNASDVDESGQVDHVANIIDFCQPLGWSLLKSPKQPQFHMVVLTDTPGCRLYTAIVNIYEAVPMPRESFDDLHEIPENQSTNGEVADVTDDNSIKNASSTPSKVISNIVAEQIPMRRGSKSSLKSASSGNASMTNYIYVPKSLIVISKFNHPEVFRSCLNVIYRVHLEHSSRFTVETAIANLVASVLVPPPGNSPVSFSLGIGLRHTIKPPIYKSVPVTGSVVYQLFHYLGVHNTLTAICCLLNEFKVVVHSTSLNHLTQCCQALVSLLYPLPYYHVYIPVLPESIIGMLSAPTPFLIGIPAVLRQEAIGQPDVVVIDLDAGSIRLPESTRLLQFSENYHNRITNDLLRVLNPELFVSDNAFGPSPSPFISNSSENAIVSSANACLADKMLRACFLRLFASLFSGYRHSLSAIRICPEQKFVFDKAHFLGQRGEAFTPSESLLCSLMTSYFPQFLQDRMMPYRETDIFDDACATISTTLAEEEINPDRIIDNIRSIAQQLLQNEQISPSGISPGITPSSSDNENFANVLATIPKPYPIFQAPDAIHVDRLVSAARDRVLAEAVNKPKMSDPPSNGKKRKVSLGNAVSIDSSMPASFIRRLEVVRKCVGHIFGNRIAEARRLLPATMRALKLVEVRRRLPSELSTYAFADSEQQQSVIAPVLSNHQFDLIVQIVVFALSLESHWDENGIAAAIMPLSTILYRYLGDSRHQQFLYTAIQDHPLWLNQSFWTSVIYRHIAAAVATVHASDSSNATPNVSAEPPLSLEVCGRYLETTCNPSQNEVNGIDNVLKKVEIKSREEESMAYSYCKHFANLMVYLLTPLDPSRDLSGLLSSGGGQGGEFAANSSHNMDGIGTESSVYSESGFDEQDLRDVKGVVHWFINRVLQNVCNDAGISDDHMRNLEAILGETVGSHMDYLEMVYQHTRHLPPLQKPRILEPNLIPGERKLLGPLRAIILPDGRRLGLNGDTWLGQAPSNPKNHPASSGQRRMHHHGAMSDITSVITVAATGDLEDASSGDHAVCLLPAEGAIFLTTYRLVFIGNPIDAFASEIVITRSIPVASLWSEKQLQAVYMHHPYDHYFTQCYQMRSMNFEIMKILFDSTEVNESAIVELRQQMSSLRWPLEITAVFCSRLLFGEDSANLTPSLTDGTLPSIKGLSTPKQSHSKSKIKTLARNTLSKLNVGANVQLSLERKMNRTTAKLSRQLNMGTTTLRASQRSTLMGHSPPGGIIHFMGPERAQLLAEDYERLKLGFLSSQSQSSTADLNSGWRLSLVNRLFIVSQSYPEIVSTLVGISEDTLKRLAQGCRMNRFPTAVWRHSGSGAVLVRSAAFMSPSNRVITAIRRSANDSSGSTRDDSLAVSSSSSLATDLINFTSSLAQITSLSAAKSEDTLRSETKTNAEPASTPISNRRGSNNIRSSPANVSACIVGDSAQIKTLKTIITDSAVDFIPVQVTSPTAIKASYKRLTQKCVCPADAGERRKRDHFNYNTTSSSSIYRSTGNASQFSDADGHSLSGEGFYKATNDSGWLQQISTLLRVSSMIAMLIDGASISVVVAAEDGSDFVTQVVCLSQLLLDPYYRTRQGFKVLVIREWLAFGHRFGFRGGQLATNRLCSYIPVFVQFLDAVHQLLYQYPTAFEFNQFFLKAMAYHTTSNRFFDWLLDCDSDRLSCGLPLYGSNPSDNKDDCPFFWDFVDKQWETSPIYSNLLYVPGRSAGVLSPKYVLPYLHIWDYFHGQPLSTDSMYDAVIALGGTLTDSVSGGTQIVVDAAFEIPETVVTNGFISALKTYCEVIDTASLADDASRQSSVSQHEVSWYDALKNAEAKKERPELNKKVSPVFHPRLPIPVSRQLFNWTLSPLTSSQLLSIARSLGSMSLNELAVSFGRGMGNQPHQLRNVSTVSKASICGACSAMLWPPTPAVACERCPLVAHRQCQARVAKMHHCSGQTPNDANNGESHKSAGPSPASPPQVIMYRSDLIASNSNHMQGSRSGTTSGTRNPNTLSGTLSRFMICGLLYKRGQLLHGLTRRFYILDLASQRIVYFESQSEAEIGGSSAEKGEIPLTQIMQVLPIEPQQPSNSNESSQASEYGFTIVTTKRSHHFLTSGQKEAERWTESILKAITML